MPFSFSGRIICGPHRGSFSVRDHLRSNLRIISGLGIICGAVQISRKGIAVENVEETFAVLIVENSVGGKLLCEQSLLPRLPFPLSA